MNYKAVGRYLLIEPIKEELKNSLGMLIEDSTIRYKKARTLSVGSLVESVKEGQTVYYDKNNSHEVIVNGQILSVVSEQAISLVES